MADFPGTFNDGGVQFGSQKVTVAGKTYVFKFIDKPAYDANRGTRTNENGVEDGQFFMGKIPQGSGTLQFATSTDPVPPQFSIISLKPIGGGAAQDFIIYACSEKFESGGETMAMISYSKKVGTGAVVP